MDAESSNEMKEEFVKEFQKESLKKKIVENHEGIPNGIPGLEFQKVSLED